MLRKLQAFLALGVWALAIPAAAQDTTDEPTSEAPPSQDEETGSDSLQESPAPEPEAPEPSTEDSATADASAGIGLSAAGQLGGDGDGSASADGEASADVTSSGDDGDSGDSGSTSKHESSSALTGWDTFVSGYFRAPMAIGISPRSGPDNPDGDPELQLSYGPNRTMDSNYFSFAYTRLQEQDWSELFVHAKKEHAEAVIGWMGYWFQAAGFRNYDAGWAPGMAYVVLDTDFELGGTKPNIAFTAGSWWPKFGRVVKYDTYTLGQFRQLGEQLKLTVPLGGLTATITQGVGTGRDGSFNLLSPPPYQAKVGLNMLHYEDIKVAYKEYLELSVHYNSQWTSDPNLYQTTQPGKAFTDVREAYLKTVGGELRLSAPVAGSLWVSPSYIRVRNGWALGEAGIEVMHSLSADSLATNYMGWSGSLGDSTGSGEMLNLGFLYENTLSGITGQPRGTVPDLTLNLFGLFADITLDLPDTSIIPQERMGQFKYGADLEYQATNWLGVMLRWDEVNYNLGHAGYAFSAISPRLTFSSHYLSGESIYVQYSRYRYGDAMTLAGRWPWGLPLVAGSDIIQGGSYAAQKPDMDVVRVQASISF